MQVGKINMVRKIGTCICFPWLQFVTVSDRVVSGTMRNQKGPIRDLTSAEFHLVGEAHPLQLQCSLNNVWISLEYGLDPSPVLDVCTIFKSMVRT
jgi:hypothetical protein